MARLGQLIKKLEIGTDTAVDFLKSNGCEIKNDLNAKLDALISPLFKPSRSSSPKAVFGASKLYLNPFSSIYKVRLPAPLLLLASTPLSSL